jgi:hypothetical protein
MSLDVLVLAMSEDNDREPSAALHCADSDIPPNIREDRDNAAYGQYNCDRFEDLSIIHLGTPFLTCLWTLNLIEWCRTFITLVYSMRLPLTADFFASLGRFICNPLHGVLH